MKKNVLFVILDKYFDWEMAYLSQLILALGQDRFTIKTISLSRDNIKSLGGLTVTPDYDIQCIPNDFEGVILVGGMSWRTEEAQKIKPLVKNALNNKKVLGAICDASVFLGKMGVLNEVKHTSNDNYTIKN